jgi:hypothetical protein
LQKGDERGATFDLAQEIGAENFRAWANLTLVKCGSAAQQFNGVTGIFPDETHEN